MERKLKLVGASTLAFVATAAFAGTAFAQDAAASGQVGMTLPGATAPAAGAVAGESDHDMMVGSLAIGYLGRRGMFVGDVTQGPGALGGRTEVSAPIIGVRYWIDSMLGIDAGLGLGITSGSTEANGVSVDDPGATAFMIHGGVPLSLASTNHFSFQIVPELNIGFGTASSTDQPNFDLSGKGLHIDVGARAGAEIHFGFIGVPQLSLQGSVGVLFAIDNTKVEEANSAAEVKRSNMSFGTTVGDNPWNIFTSNVAALYYF